MDPDTTPSPPPPAADPYAAWRMGSYQLYAASWFLMTFGKEVEAVAMGICVYHQTGNSAMALGWLGMVRALPVMILAIPGGHIADHWQRRGVVVVMLAIAAVLTAALTVAVYWQVPVLWIYLLILAGAIGQALGGPSRAALLPQLVPSSTFSNAVAWNSTVFQIARVSGPAVGGLIIAWAMGVPAALALVVLCRLAAMLAAMFLPRRAVDQRQAAETISLESLGAGVRFVWRQKPVLAAITLDLFAVLFGGVNYLLPVFVENILHFQPSHVGLGVGFLQSADAAGAIVMAMLLTHLPPIRRAGRTMLWAVAAYGLATIVFGLSRWFGLSLAMMFLVGAVDNISVVVRHTMVQMLTPDPMRGRVSAVNNVFIVASNDLGGLESGLTAQLFGPIISVVGGGIATILIVLGAAALWPQLMGIGSLHNLRPAEEELGTSGQI
jgi:MFS family permease